jgi:hypothetical protein
MSLSSRIGLALLAVALSLPSGAAERWIHVEVDEGGSDGTRVRIQLPFSVVRAALPHLRADVLDGGRIFLEADAIDAEDLAEARKALDAALAGRPVVVGDPDRPVRIERDGKWVRLTASDPDRSRVRIQMPVALAREVLDDLPGSIDLLALLDALGAEEDVDLVEVEEDDTKVRIRIDERPSTD